MLLVIKGKKSNKDLPQLFYIVIFVNKDIKMSIINRFSIIKTFSEVGKMNETCMNNFVGK
jgi:hypothetical protein